MLRPVPLKGPVLFARGALLVILLIGVSAEAPAELIQVRLAELETTYRWLRDTDSGEEFGGPVTVSFQLPEEVVAVRSVSLLIQGELHAGGEWSLGCPQEECGPLVWYTTRFELAGPCLSFTHGEHYGYEPGPFLYFLEFEDCAGFDEFVGTEVEITAWSHMVTRSPQNGWSPEPTVDISNLVLQFDVDAVVRAEDRPVRPGQGAGTTLMWPSRNMRLVA